MAKRKKKIKKKRPNSPQAPSSSDFNNGLSGYSWDQSLACTEEVKSPDPVSPVKHQLQQKQGFTIHVPEVKSGIGNRKKKDNTDQFVSAVQKRLYKLIKKKTRLKQELQSTKIPELSGGQKMTPAFKKRQERVQTDIDNKKAELEQVLLHIKGVETGVIDILDDVLVPMVIHSAAMDPDLRPFWLAFRQQYHFGSDDVSHYEMRIAPPEEFANRPNAETFGPAHAAAIFFDMEVLEEIVGQSETVEWYLPEPGLQNTPLHLAIMMCDPFQIGFERYKGVARYLAENTPYEYIASENDDGDTPLVLASSVGNLDVVKTLCRRAPETVNAVAVFKSLEIGDDRVLDWLLEFIGENKEYLVEAQIQLEQTGLHLLIECAARDLLPMSKYPVLMDKLIHYGLDINGVNIRGETPLHIACKEQSVDPLALDLLTRGADFNAIDPHFKKPVDYITNMDKGMLKDMFKFYCSQILAEATLS